MPENKAPTMTTYTAPAAPLTTADILARVAALPPAPPPPKPIRMSAATWERLKAAVPEAPPEHAAMARIWGTPVETDETVRYGWATLGDEMSVRLFDFTPARDWLDRVRVAIHRPPFFGGIEP